MKKILTQINKFHFVISGLILALLSIFYTKAFDVGFIFLALPRDGEFLGLVLRLSDFVLVGWLIYISYVGIKQLKDKICHFEHSEKSKTQSDKISHFVRNDSVTQNTKVPIWKNTSKQTIIALVLFISLVVYWIAINSSTWYSFKNGILGYTSLFFSLALLYKYKPNWLIVLVPYFCFDHIIVSSSLISLMLVSLGYLAWCTSTTIDSKPDQSHCERSAATSSLSTPQPPSLRLDPLKGVRSDPDSSNYEHPNLCHPELVSGSKNTQHKTIITTLLILTLTITTNLLLATYQILWGHSLGLYFLGESKLELSGIIGIAKQALSNSDQILLRGYGLMPHPNILGFLGVFGVIVGLEFKQFFLKLKKIKQFYTQIVTNILIISSFVLGLISMSRMAIISLLILIIIYVAPIKLIAKIWCNTILYLVILSSCVAIYTFVSFDFKADSDNYRLEQYQTMYKLIEQEPQVLFFGTGTGQYSQHLKKANITTESWENEPFYHPIGNIVLELGLVGVGLIAFLYKKLQESK